MDPEYLEAHIKELYENGEHAECLNLCNELIQINNENKIANDYMAICLLKLGYYDEAIKIYNKIIIRGKQDFSHYIFRGDCFFKLGLYNNAMQDFIESLNIDPKAGASWQRVAECYFMLGDYNEAHINIDRAIEISDKDREPWAFKALFLKFQGRTAEAFNMMTEIKKVYPDYDFLRIQQFEILANALNKKLNEKD